MIPATVTQLAGHIKLLIESDPLLGSIWVLGEVSNLSRPASGHRYFTLKDSGAQVRCAMFRQRSTATSQAALQSGAQVLAHGHISFYEARGDLQFYVDAVQPEGVGVLQAEFERLLARLEAEGLFAPERKRPLPPFPRRIGVVTSPSGAVFHDICTVLGRRWPLTEIVLAPTQVQGDGAAAGIVAGIDGLNRSDGIDVIIIARGGGSLEDLWAFNEEPVVRAIFSSRIPVISAIGHETDYTLADYVADLRAPTPSAAAELVVPDRLEFAMRIGSAMAGLNAGLQRVLNERRDALEDAAAELQHCCPDPASLKVRVDALLTTMRRGTSHVLQLRGERLDGRQRQLETLSPRQTLARGYALVQLEDGSLLAGAAKARAGQRLEIQMHDGGIGARVEGKAATSRSGHARPDDAQTRLL